MKNKSKKYYMVGNTLPVADKKMVDTIFHAIIIHIIRQTIISDCKGRN